MIPCVNERKDVAATKTQNATLVWSVTSATAWIGKQILQTHAAATLEPSTALATKMEVAPQACVVIPTKHVSQSLAPKKVVAVTKQEPATMGSFASKAIVQPTHASQETQAALVTRMVCARMTFFAKTVHAMRSHASQQTKGKKQDAPAMTRGNVGKIFSVQAAIFVAVAKKEVKAAPANKEPANPAQRVSLARTACAKAARVTKDALVYRMIVAAQGHAVKPPEERKPANLAVVKWKVAHARKVQTV